MREMVRKCPELQAADVLREVLPSCSPEVRELLCRNLDTIRRDMHRTRARMARVAAAAGGDGGKKPTKRKNSSDPGKSNKCQKLSDDAAALCGDLLGVPGQSGLMRNTEDLVKDELIVEDYGEASDGGLVETCYEESESSELATEGGDENPSTAQDGPAPFESVVCDTIIKEEPVAIEDESENFEMIDSATEPSGVGEGSLGALARFTNTLGAPTQVVPGQLVQASTPNSCSATTTTNYSATNLIGISGTDVPAGSNNAPIFSATNNLPISVANTRITSTNPPGKPPQGTAFPCHCDDSGVFISLKNVPMKRRKKTKEKLIRLVKLITELDLDPDEVSFTVTTK